MSVTKTACLNFRTRPAVRRMLRDVAMADGITMTDFVVAAIHAAHAAKFPKKKSASEARSIQAAKAAG